MPQPEPTKNVPQNVAEILRQHVTLQVECIDRMYLNVYVPKLQTESGAVWFFRGHRQATFASSALMAPISRAFVSEIDRYAQTNEIPVVQFRRGQRKDDVARDASAREIQTGRGGGVHRQGARERTRISDREAPE